MDSGHQVDLVLLDLAKAFDKVPHVFLVHKLKQFGFHGNMLAWFRSYLSNRRQRVIVGGSASSFSPVTSGVPQGSILGPLLFLLYINDMPKVTMYSDVALFADDTKCFKTIRSYEDCQALQADLDALFSWSKKWKMYFNVNKCHVITITNKRNPLDFAYTIADHELSRESSVRDLGVTIETNLSWNKHIQSSVAKANRTMGCVKRAVGYHVEEKVKKQLYCSLVRPQLEYCSPLWNGTTRKNTFHVERLQRSATRFMVGYEDLNYQERLTRTSLLPLSYRRDIADLVHLFKCIHGDIDIDNLPVTMAENSVRHTRQSTASMKLTAPRFRTESFGRSYFNRTVTSWNKLPEDARSLSHVKNFKGYLNQYFKTMMDEQFDVNSLCTWSHVCRCTNCRS